MKVTLIDQIDIGHVLKTINDDKLWTFASNEWYRLLQPYTPHRTGKLEQNVTIGRGTITYKAPYSTHVYLGLDMNFRTAPNPKATAEWDKRAIQEKQDEKLYQSVADWIKKNLGSD